MPAINAAVSWATDRIARHRASVDVWERKSRGKLGLSTHDGRHASIGSKEREDTHEATVAAARLAASLGLRCYPRHHYHRSFVRDMVGAADLSGSVEHEFYLGILVVAGLSGRAVAGLEIYPFEVERSSQIPSV
jgi:hypothetical protein